MEDRRRKQPAASTGKKRSQPADTKRRPPQTAAKRRPPQTAGKKRERNSPAAQMARQRRMERAAEQTSEIENLQQEPVEDSQTRPARRERNSKAAQMAQVKREERKKRDSRAAAEAQRRREDRKERARLDGMRDKQKKKAKHRTRRRISPDAWKKIVIMAAVIVAVIVSMVIFFRVRTVEVEGNRYYSAQEIIDAASVMDGDNLLTLSRGEIAGNVIAKLPYIKNVRVTRQLPDSVVLRVTEYESTYAIKDTNGDYYLITAAGKATEQLGERDARSHIVVEEMTIYPPTIGEVVTPTCAEGKEAEAKLRLSALLQLLQEIENAELSKYVVSVQVPSAYQLSLWYGDRFEVRLGNRDKLAYKLEFLKVVISQQKDYVSGVIDLSLNEGNEAHVIKNE